MTESSYAVFLSYASEDATAAQRIADALRAAGIEVWFDKSELRGGDAWDRLIRQQIRDCALFIPLVSQHSQERLEGYFRLEWKLAVDRSHRMAAERTFIVPMVVDSTRERDALVPDAFRDVQWTYLPGGETPPAFVDRVRRLLSPQTPADRAAPSTAPAGFTAAETSRKPAPRPWRSKPALWVIGALMAATLTYFATDRFWISKRTAAATTSAALPSATAPEKSIAVLPFVDLSEKHDHEYFADGMAEEIIELLAKVPQLKVVGRTSSFRFKGKSDDLRALGTRLGANFILEGSVRGNTDRIRITAQLVAAPTGFHIWSETYDRPFADALRVQTEIAVSLVRALQVAVGAADLPEHPVIQNPRAYDAYLRARFARDRGDKIGLEESVRYYEEAARLDPRFLPAALGVARAYLNLLTTSMEPRETAYPRAKAETLAVVKAYPESAAAHAMLARVLQYNFEWAAAQEEMRKASTLGPRDQEVIALAGTLASSLGDWGSALSLTTQALEGDPLNPAIVANLADYQLRSGHAQKSEGLGRRALDISPTETWPHFTLGQALLEQGKLQEALDAFNATDLPDAQLLGRAAAYHAMGRKEESDKAMRGLEEHWGKAEPFEVAMAHAYRGELDLALPWLARAAEKKDVWITECLGDPSFKDFTEDPRYRAWLRSVDLPEQ